MLVNRFLIAAFFYLVRRLNTVLENNLTAVKKTQWKSECKYFTACVNYLCLQTTDIDDIIDDAKLAA